ncbi:MAG: glycosyltransferase, partial [Myxococcota bacterium]
MRYLFDISHPAHVHFFRHMISELERRGHATTVVARKKDVTVRLLEDMGFDFVAFGAPSSRGRLGQLRELLTRDWRLIRAARAFGADAIVTRNPSGVQAARALGIPGIFDTDDGPSAGIHFYAAYPFATHVTSPDCFPEVWGKRHSKYADCLYPRY